MSKVKIEIGKKQTVWNILSQKFKDIFRTKQSHVREARRYKDKYILLTQEEKDKRFNDDLHYYLSMIGWALWVAVKLFFFIVLLPALIIGIFLGMKMGREISNGAVEGMIRGSYPHNRRF